ncbi:hypothetical protein C0U44_31740, partial [Klebsiella pneumoniae]
ILAQILHCGTFTVCHLAAMRYIAARQGSEVIRRAGRLLRGGDPCADPSLWHLHGVSSGGDALYRRPSG